MADLYSFIHFRQFFFMWYITIERTNKADHILKMEGFRLFIPKFDEENWIESLGYVNWNVSKVGIK